jgi:hypothetical protein
MYAYSNTWSERQAGSVPEKHFFGFAAGGDFAANHD